MPSLDIRTLSFVAMVSSVLLALGLQIVHRIMLNDPSLRLWAKGAMSAGAGFVLMALRGVIPELFSIVLANSLLVASAAWQYLGMRSFQGRGPIFPWYGWLTAANAVAFCYFTYLAPNLAARIVVVSAVLAALRFGSAFVLLRPVGGADRVVRWFVAGSLLLTTGFLAARAIVNLFTGSVSQDFMAMTSSIQTFAFVFEIGLTLVLGAGLPILVLGRTQRRLLASEDRYRTLIEWSPEPMGVHDGGKVLYVNPAAVRMLGASSAQDLIGRSALDFVDVDSRQSASVRAQAAAGDGLTALPIEARLLTLDGSPLDVELRSTQINYDGAEAVLTVMRDVTARKRAEAELEQYRSRLESLVDERTADLVLARNAAEAANKAKSIFLSNMSHELRTPLNAILGFSSLMMRDRSQGEEQRRTLEIIYHSGASLLDLINNVLEMSQIEAGRVQLDSVPFDLGSMLRDLGATMRLRAQAKGLNLSVVQLAAFPSHIRGDEARLRQVLTNLVGNAIKFTNQGGVTLRCGATFRPGQPTLQIEVEDTGPGISEQDQQRLFQPFVQLGELAASNSGTGLGLAITREYVHLMGGSISVKSEIGRGALFRVELPLSEAVPEDSAERAETEQAEVIGLAPGQASCRILIAEDQPENQLLLGALIRRIGFESCVAQDGAQAIELFQSWQPQLIFMDRRMPVMDGLQATKAIRQLPGGRAVKIIAVTASVLAEERAEMMAAGMDDFVRKPYQASEIYARLGQHLGVRYNYAEVLSQEAQAAVETVSVEALVALPATLRTELDLALHSLSSERIDAVLKMIEPFDAELHQSLRRRVDNFDYPAILAALQPR